MHLSLTVELVQCLTGQRKTEIQIIYPTQLESLQSTQHTDIKCLNSWMKRLDFRKQDMKQDTRRRNIFFDVLIFYVYTGFLNVYILSEDLNIFKMTVVCVLLCG